MASDFIVAWQCLSKRTIGFLLWIKLHAPVLHGYQRTSSTGVKRHRIQIS
jgi:hypothetical protein